MTIGRYDKNPMIRTKELKKIKQETYKRGFEDGYKKGYEDSESEKSQELEPTFDWGDLD